VGASGAKLGAMLTHAPRCSPADAERIARDCFRVDGQASALTSERDQNFLISPRDGDGLVLKIANALERPAMVDAQQRALEHLAHTGVPAPRVVRGGGGCTATVRCGDAEHLAWAITVLPGRPLA